MNIIALDDERLALAALEQAIREAEPNCALAGFISPQQALAHARENPVDVAFLDIEMFNMDGLSLAKQLKDINGNTNIIFVTGYTHYAARAFALHPSGYLRKPVSARDIANELANLRHPLPKPDNGVRIQCFGNFEIFVNNKAVHFHRSRAREILAYLVDRKGAGVSKKELAGLLWGDAEYTRSLQSHIQTLVAEMRRALKAAGAEHIIINRWNSLALNTSAVECDYYDFAKGDMAAVNAYHGEYMVNYPWAEFTAGWLNKKSRAGE